VTPPVPPDAAAPPDPPPALATTWRNTVRIVASRFPPVDLFERIADPADWDALFAVEAMTNPRLREAADALRTIPLADRATGPGASLIMAPFTHLPPGGGRFSTATFGAWYAAFTRETAIAETVHHRARFLAATAEPAQAIDLRVLMATVTADVDDLRGAPRFAALLDPGDYTASQRFAAERRAAGRDGLCYDSVRHPGGNCLAIWRPRCVRTVRQAAHLSYVWDGRRITGWFEKSRFTALG
jgi:RES domain-containing protein